VIGIVVALYCIRPPPRRVVIPSRLVWDRVLREGHAGSERLRWWLSLLLAAVIATLIAGAIPALHSGGASAMAPRLILVLDDSPTMATRTTDGATRWDHALAKARALLQARAPGTRVWLADTMRRVITPGFDDRDEALARVAQMRVSYGFVPQLPLPQQHDGIETVVITDGVSLETVPATAKVETVFESVENAGITAFEVRALPADPRRYLAYVELVNAGGIEKTIELTVAGVGNRRVSRVVTLPAGGTRSEMLDISGFHYGPVRASIVMPGDGLAVDDVAYAIMPVRRVMRVALVTSGNPYLQKFLEAQPRVSLTVISPGRYADDRDFDAVVFDRFTPKAPPRVPALLFRPPGAGWLPASAKDIWHVSAEKWDSGNPLLENVSLVDLRVDHAAVMRIEGHTAGADTVLASAHGDVPLIVAHEQETRWISFSFALEDSNFALHAGFPIFLDNVLKWMQVGQVTLARGLGLSEVPVSNARIVAPDGTELPTRSIARGTAFEAAIPGLFTVVSAHERLWVAANLLDRKVTEVNKSRLPPPTADAGAGAGTRAPVAFDPWFVPLLIASLLLMLEWWSWNRRMTV
jgi:hypothetical protein